MTKQWSPDSIQEQLSEAQAALERLHAGYKYEAHTASAALKLLTLGTGDAPFTSDLPTLLTLKAGDQKTINGEWSRSSDRHYGTQQVPAMTKPSGAIPLRFHVSMLSDPNDPYSEKRLYFGLLSYLSTESIADITGSGGELVADLEVLDDWAEYLSR